MQLSVFNSLGDRMTQKEKKKIREKIILVILLAIFVGIAGFSAYQILNITNNYREGRLAYESLLEEMTIKTEEKEEVAVEPYYLQLNYEALNNRNSDFIGWIRMRDTVINYPIVQARDNDFYLHRSIDKGYLYSGTIFMDFRNSGDWSDLNSIIYGHRMNDGSMFGTLPKFANKAYWDEHRSFEIYRDNKVYIYSIYSFYKTKASGDTYQIYFNGDKAKSDWISATFNNSMYSSGQYVGINDHVITLSTCVRNEDDNRWVLHAVLTNVIDLAQESNS